MITSIIERRWFAIGLIVLLGVIHSTLSFVSLSTKSPTFDESIHALGGYSIRFLNDYRIDPEDPALWHRIHALAARRDEATIDQNSVVWKKLTEDSGLEFLMAHQTYFESGRSNVESVINRRRALLSIFGAFVVIGSGLLARSLARTVGLPVTPAGLFTSALLAFDPTLLAHSSIIKNDVMMAMLTLGLSASLWSIGRRVTWVSLFGLITCAALAPAIKFSGVFLAPIAAIALLTRALTGRSLPMGHWNLSTRFSRVTLSLGILLATALIGYVALWASYGFQFSVTADGTPFSFSRLIDLAKANLYRDTYGMLPPWSDLTPLPMDRAAKLVSWATEHRLAPEAWLFGLLQVHVFTGNRTSYLFGQTQDGGFWYYFPVAFLLKTPVATSVMLSAAIAILISRLTTLRNQFEHLWILISIALPALLILMLSMQSGMNIGIRHILPIWPAFFICIGLFAAWLWTRRSYAFRFLVLGTTSLSVLESCIAAPNYIPFFNVFCGNAIDRLSLMTDSNLDWGQDLSGLGKWRKNHPHVPLYLSYFGTADPRYYGIDYINITPRYIFKLETVEPDLSRPGVIAYSATNLTAVYAQNMRDYFASVRERKPIAIIGESIFLYKWPFDMPDDEWEAATGIPVKQ